MNEFPGSHLLEEYALATRDLAEAVASEDWPSALAALERRERLLPELGKAFSKSGSSSSIIAKLEDIIRSDTHSRAGLLEARSRISGRLRDVERMAHWARSSRLADETLEARLADVKG